MKVKCTALPSVGDTIFYEDAANLVELVVESTPTPDFTARVVKCAGRATWPIPGYRCPWTWDPRYFWREREAPDED